MIPLTVIEPGWLYLLTNPAMPGLVKIGMTTRSPEERAQELASTGVPMPFHVSAAWAVDDVRAAERDAHEALARYRVSDQREWFRLSGVTSCPAFPQGTEKTPAAVSPPALGEKRPTHTIGEALTYVTRKHAPPLMVQKGKSPSSPSSSGRT